jgi:hypothetical protein
MPGLPRTAPHLQLVVAAQSERFLQVLQELVALGLLLPEQPEQPAAPGGLALLPPVHRTDGARAES